MTNVTQVLVSQSLSEIHLGIAQLTTTMECLAESRPISSGDAGAAVDALDTLSTLAHIYVDKLEKLMLIVDTHTDN